MLAEQLDPGSAEYTQSKVHYQHQLIQEARRKAEDGEDGADFQFLDQAGGGTESARNDLERDPERTPITRLEEESILQSTQAGKPRVAYPTVVRLLIHTSIAMNPANLF